MREAWRKQAIEDLLEEYQVQEDKHLADLLYEYAETAMRLTLTEEENYQQVGNSRIAGRPDLPATWSWPCTEDGEWCTFLAQVNLAELPFCPIEDLPTHGILYFFIGADEPAYHIEHSVLFYNGDMNELVLASPPSDKEEVLADMREFVPFKISFSPQLSLSDVGEEEEWLWTTHEELYQAIANQSDALWGGLQSWAGDTALDAYLCKNNMEDLLYQTHYTLEELEQRISALRESGMAYADKLEQDVLPLLASYKQKEEEHKMASRRWHLLFSISSLDEVGMCWWDAGFLEFLIDREDLRQHNFERTYLSLATS